MSCCITNLGLFGREAAAAVGAGAGATREAKEAAGPARVGSKMISIFIGRSGEAERVAIKDMRAREEKRTFVSWLNGGSRMK